MSNGLDVIIVDDDPDVVELLSGIINSFYTWGNVFVFTDVNEAIEYCLLCDHGIAIFVVDVFLGEKSGFLFLDSIAEKFTSAHEDAIMITGHASDDVVNMCEASDIHYLLEKPLRPYALQMSVRAIAMKYLKFAKKVLKDSAFAACVSRVGHK